MKRITAVILSLSLIFAMVPFNAFAAEDVPEKQEEPPAKTEPEIDPATVHLNGVTEKEEGAVYGASITFKEKVYYYKNIQAAFGDAIADDVVKVEKSIALSDKLCLYPEVPVTLDLNGKTITCGNNRIFIGYDGTETYDSDVTFTDSAGGGRIAASINQTAVYVSSGKFTFAGGSIINTYSPENGYAYGIYATRSSTVNITGGSVLAEIAVMARPATVNVKGGILTGTFCAGVYANGSDGTDSVVNMEDGLVYCAEYAGIYGDGGAEINVRGGSVYGKYGLFLYDKTQAVMDGGTVSASSAAAAVARSSRMTLNEGRLECSVLVEYEGATFVMNGGTIATEGNDIAVMGNAEEGHGGTEIIINGGTITSDTTAIYLPQEGKTTIKGGNITGAAGIEIKSGRLNIDPISDEVLAVAAKGVPYVAGSPSSNMDNEDGVAVAVTGDVKYSGNIEVSISGGTFISNYGIGFWAYQPEGSRCIKSISINGGIFDGGSYASKEYNGCAAAGMRGIIKGGTFTNDPGVLLSRRAAVKEENGNFTAVEGITFTGEKSDIEKNEQTGKTAVSVTKAGKDAAGNDVLQVITTVRNRDNTVAAVSEEMTFSYEKFNLAEKRTIEGKTDRKDLSSVEIKGIKDTVESETLSQALGLLSESMLEMECQGADPAGEIRITTGEKSVTFTRMGLEALKQQAQLLLITGEGQYLFSREDLQLILDRSEGETVALSADSMELINEVLVQEAKERYSKVTSISKNDSRVTVKWNPAEGADGYNLRLITGGKTYDVKVDDPEASSYTFDQKVIKAYRVKVCSYTEVAGEEICSSWSYKTSITKPTVTKISKSSKTKKVTVNWKKLSSVDGYVVKLIYKGKTYTKTITKNSTVKYTFSKKVYSSYKIKIASYAVMEGKKVYSGYRTYSRK